MACRICAKENGIKAHRPFPAKQMANELTRSFPGWTVRANVPSHSVTYGAHDWKLGNLWVFRVYVFDFNQIYKNTAIILGSHNINIKVKITRLPLK